MESNQAAEETPDSRYASFGGVASEKCKSVLRQDEEKRRLEEAVSFPQWREELEGSGLPERDVDSYSITIKWYLGYCRKARCQATRGTANAFIETVRREKLPTSFQMTMWFNALRWFFRSAPARGDAAEEIPRPSVAAEHEEEGSEPWFDAFIGEIRRRHYSYHTEVSYLQWARGFSRFHGTNALASLGEADIRTYLD